MGGKFITVGILISLFGALNGYLLTGPRIVYTLGEQKNLPAALGKLSKNGVNSERERRPKKNIIIAMKFVKNENI